MAAAATLALVCIPLVSGTRCRAQASGNIISSQSSGRARAEQLELAKRFPAPAELPPDASSVFVDADALMNVLADEYVATFALAQECAAVAECAQELAVTLAQLEKALRALGIPAADVYVDFAAQEKVYAYQVSGDLAKEELVGFELKKNVSIHYRDKDMLDALLLAAARSNVFDLVKATSSPTSPR